MSAHTATVDAPPVSEADFRGAQHELDQLRAELSQTLQRLGTLSQELNRGAETLRAQAQTLAPPQGDPSETLVARAQGMTVPVFDPKPFNEQTYRIQLEAIRAQVAVGRAFQHDAERYERELNTLRDTIERDTAALRALKQRPATPPPVPPAAAAVAETQRTDASPAPVTATPPPPPPQAAPRGAERRQFVRHDVQVSVDFASEHNFYTGLSNDLSEGGLFIATIDILPIGAPIDLTLTLPGGHAIQARGQVRWVRDYNDNTPEVAPGMGVQFTQLPGTDSTAIQRFLLEREPFLYCD